MSQEYFVVAERIIADLEAVFRRDLMLDEFAIIPSSDNQNRSPVIHVEHKLALEDWCFKPLFQYSYHEVLKIRKTGKIDELEKIAQLSRVALLLNPDISTFWNIRKSLMLAGVIDTSVDLLLTKLTLSRKPKCPEAFNQRRWIMLQLKDHGEIRLPQVSALLDTEYAVCEAAAIKYASNYHAWSYRSWVRDTFLANLSHLAIVTELFKEWYSTENWIFANVSDHSGFHYRQTILDSILRLPSYNKKFYDESVTYTKDFCKKLNNKKNSESLEYAFSGKLNFEYNFVCRLGLLLHESSISMELLQLYNAHEALWYHRRFIFVKILQFLRNEFNNMLNKKIACDLYEPLKQNEVELAYSLLRENDVSDISEHQTVKNHNFGHGNLSDHHIKWIAEVPCKNEN